MRNKTLNMIGLTVSLIGIGIGFVGMVTASPWFSLLSLYFTWRTKYWIDNIIKDAKEDAATDKKSL